MKTPTENQATNWTLQGFVDDMLRTLVHDGGRWHLVHMAPCTTINMRNGYELVFTTDAPLQATGTDYKPVYGTRTVRIEVTADPVDISNAY